MRNAISLRNRIPLLAMACSAALFGTDARAQAPIVEVDSLEEIIVTAKRRSEDLQTASLSATVLNQDLLENKGVVDLYALQYAAPAVTVTQYGSANVFNIRGLGRSQVDIDVPSGVVIYRDGTPTLAGYFQNEPYFDMESIEVYRGPQGTFVGKNAAGGAVFINTNDPKLGEEFDGSVELGGGDYSAYEATGIVNIPDGRDRRAAAGVSPCRARSLLRRDHRGLHRSSRRSRQQQLPTGSALATVGQFLGDAQGRLSRPRLRRQSNDRFRPGTAGRRRAIRQLCVYRRVDARGARPQVRVRQRHHA